MTVRLCFVNSLRGWGGAEVWMLDTAVALAGRGIETGIITQPDSALLGRARAAGIPTAAIPIRTDGSPVTLARLVRQFRRWRPRAIIANLTKDVKAAAPAAQLAGVPCRLATRESDFALRPRPHYRWFFTRAATGVLVNSEATRRTLLDSAPWLDQDRVHLLYKGIDLVRFNERAAAPQTGTVGFAGQLIERKGLASLMAAWSALEREPGTPARRLLIAGQGQLRPQLEQWRAGLARPQAVELVGHVEDLTPFYQSLDVLAMPSVSEGFGLVAAEAAACGVPVVATRASSLPEVVADGRTGLLVPLGDDDALAGALRRVLADPALADRLGRAGRARVAECFGLEGSLDRLVQLTGV